MNFQSVKFRKTFAVLVAGLALTTSACVTSGKYFASDTGWIKANKTRQDDVRGLLGAPFMVGNSGGSPTWTYGFYRYKLLGDSFTKELKFYWNADRTVQSYAFNSSFPDDVGGISSSGPRTERPAAPPSDERGAGAGDVHR
jgi:outer membrane protein assembly factor BamE (lipoprotein component of BamABCDE complex)